MDKYVMIRYNEDTGNCVVTEPCDVVAQVYSTHEEIQLPREPRKVEFTNPRKVEFTNPISMSVYEDENPIGRARKEGYDNGFTFGRNEVWSLAHDIVFDSRYGVDFITFGGWNSLSDIFNDTYEHVYDVVQRWRGRPKRFDIVKVRCYDGEKEAIITRVDDNEVDLMCRGGGTCRRYIDAVTKTGKTLEYGLLKWVKGE